MIVMAQNAVQKKKRPFHSLHLLTSTSAILSYTESIAPPDLGARLADSRACAAVMPF